MNTSKKQLKLKPMATWNDDQFSGRLVCAETGTASSSVSSGYVPISQVKVMVEEIAGNKVSFNIATLARISKWFSNEYVMSDPGNESTTLVA